MMGRGRNRLLLATVLSYVVALVLLLLAVLAATWQQVPVGDLTRDPAVVLDGHPFTGAISFIGILCWSATASICLFASGLENRRSAPDRAGFLFAAAGLTGLLLVDDLFMLHDWIVPVYLGIPELLIYVTYALLALVYVIFYRQVILDHAAWLFAAAAGFFVLSVGTDLVIPDGPGIYVWEDGLKFLGIISWSLFHISAAHRALAPPFTSVR